MGAASMTWALDTATVSAALGAVAGLGVPTLIARIPEPAQDLVLAGDASVVTKEAKEPYASIASAPGLAWKAAVASGVSAGLVGLAVGWRWPLLPLLVLVPVGVALAVVDWRTRLLPTKVIVPTYAVVGVLAVVAAALGDDWPSLVRAVWGLVLARGTFWLLWLAYPRGMGFGDVRLSGVLGTALGLLGWGELTLGVYAGFVIGGVSGLALSAVRVVDRRAYPFGPFMLLGALVGVLFGDPLAEVYLGRL